MLNEFENGIQEEFFIMQKLRKIIRILFYPQNMGYCLSKPWPLDNETNIVPQNQLESFDNAGLCTVLHIRAVQHY